MDNPQAVVGHLCIYEGQGSASTKIIVDPTDNGTDEANRWGTTLLFIGGPTDNFGRGTWAATAP